VNWGSLGGQSIFICMFHIFTKYGAGWYSDNAVGLYLGEYLVQFLVVLPAILTLVFKFFLTLFM
jgi:hypothetical protein